MIMAEPKCRYFGKCGGCSTQNIDYDVQVENKVSNLKNMIKFDDVQSFSDVPYNYRNRMDFIFNPKGLGFRIRRKWDQIVDIDRCEIADDGINDFMNEIKGIFSNEFEIDAFNLRQQVGTFKFAVVRKSSIDSSISFVLNEDSTKLGEAVETIKEYAKNSTANNLLITYVGKKNPAAISEEYFAVKGKDWLAENVCGKKFWYHAQGFFQNNSSMAEKMLQYSRDLLIKYDTKQSHLLDIYGGVGTFGIVNSDLFKKVTIIESYDKSIEGANMNILENGIENAEAVVLDAKHLRRVNLPTPLYVITDPPRSGMDLRTINRLNEIEPEVIIYISCNIQQMAKEIPKFKNYEIKSAAIFDLFPQTNHCEGVVELVKKKELND